MALSLTGLSSPMRVTISCTALSEIAPLILSEQHIPSTSGYSLYLHL